MSAGHGKGLGLKVQVPAMQSDKFSSLPQELKSKPLNSISQSEPRKKEIWVILFLVESYVFF
jgi:hypothetical protein